VDFGRSAPSPPQPDGLRVWSASRLVVFLAMDSGRGTVMWIAALALLALAVLEVVGRAGEHHESVAEDGSDGGDAAAADGPASDQTTVGAVVALPVVGEAPGQRARFQAKSRPGRWWSVHVLRVGRRVGPEPARPAVTGQPSRSYRR